MGDIPIAIAMTAVRLKLKAFWALLNWSSKIVERPSSAASEVWLSSAVTTITPKVVEWVIMGRPRVGWNKVEEGGGQEAMHIFTDPRNGRLMRRLCEPLLCIVAGRFMMEALQPKTTCYNRPIVG